MSETSGPMVRRINREMVLLLGWGRAILLQLAHPLVATAVAEHSHYGDGFVQYVRRTRQTVGSMLSLTFGTPPEVEATAARINSIHRRVHGYVTEGTDRFPSGTFYTATDPQLLRWVHMTLIESQLLAYEMFVAPLRPEERDRYCAETADLAPLLAIPDRFLPVNYGELTGHLQAGYADGTIEVTDTARHLAANLLFPPGGLPSRWLLGVGRLATVGMLPGTVREAYGFAWRPSQARRLKRLARLLRWTHRVSPGLVTRWPASRTPEIATQSGGCPLHQG